MISKKMHRLTSSKIKNVSFYFCEAGFKPDHSKICKSNFYLLYIEHFYFTLCLLAMFCGGRSDKAHLMVVCVYVCVCMKGVFVVLCVLLDGGR